MRLNRKSFLFLVFLPMFSLASHRSINIENNSNYPMHIVSNSLDLKIDHMIPSYAHSTIINRITPVPNATNILLEAILKDSADKIIHAIAAGASVNCEINGKKPLEWAVLLAHAESIKCLVTYGATL